jgi:N-acetylglucosamine-6-phosphate deacetylase
VPGVLGIHVEGPFLNPAKRGIHDAINIRDIDEAALKVLTRPVRGRIMVTLAPEKVGNASIRRLNEAGVIVSAGHTDASYDEMKEGFENGVTSMTHLFNAMSPMNARAPGAVGAALENRSVHCGIIVDGFHVHPAALRLALSIGPLSRFLLVTDAMPAVGTSLNRFTLGDVEIQVSGGRCIDAAGTLAGAHLTMAEAVSNAQNLLGTSFAQAVSLASTNPARLLGLHMRGRIAAGFIADLAALDGATVTDTWISGKHHEA